MDHPSLSMRGIGRIPFSSLDCQFLMCIVGRTGSVSWTVSFERMTSVVSAGLAVVYIIIYVNANIQIMMYETASPDDTTDVILSNNTVRDTDPVRPRH